MDSSGGGTYLEEGSRFLEVGLEGYRQLRFLPSSPVMFCLPPVNDNVS